MSRKHAVAVAALLVILAAGARARAGDDAELARLRREVEEVRAVVACVRGLSWKRDVPVRIERDPPKDSRYSAYYDDSGITVVDPAKLVWAEWGLLRRTLLAHELTHALDDQSYDLGRCEAAASNDDARLAMRACIEGEATFVALACALRESRLEALAPSERLPPLGGLGLLGFRVTSALRRRPLPPGTPPPARDPFLFPYTRGLSFVQAVVRARGRGMSGLDGLLLDPPRSTEQVLHPTKYLAAHRDEPVPVPVPPPDPGEWRLESRETLGEWGIRALLADRGLPARRAAEAAAGWGGDTAALYVRGGDRVRIWCTRWDGPAEAERFASAYRELPRPRGSAVLVRVESPDGVRIREVLSSGQKLVPDEPVLR